MKRKPQTPAQQEKKNTYMREYYRTHLEERNACSRKYAKEHREVMRASSRRWIWKKACPNLDNRELAVLERRAHGRCEICTKLPAEGRAHCVDHDHNPKLGNTKMAIRGILCRSCNLRLGFVLAPWGLLSEKQRTFLIKACQRQEHGELVEYLRPEAGR